MSRRPAKPAIAAGKSVTDPQLAERLRAYVRAVGERAALAHLEIGRLTLARAAAGLGNHRATLTHIQMRLDLVAGRRRAA